MNTPTAAADGPGAGSRWGRRLRALALLLLILGPAPTHLACLGEPAFADGGPPIVYVYLHTDAKFADLERVLKTKLPALDVTVFGRFRDFEEAMAARPPDAVLGIGALLAGLNLAPTLQGWRSGSDSESYALLSVDNALDASLTGKVIGSVDLLGRAATQAFVVTLLGGADIHFKRVTKREDLLPLLQLAAADGVVAPSTTVREMLERSRLPLRVRELGGARVKLAAVGVRTPATRDAVIRQVQALDEATNRLLGVDAWRTP